MQNFCENIINVVINLEFLFTTFQIPLTFFFQEPKCRMVSKYLINLSELRMYMYMCLCLQAIWTIC